LRHCRENLTDAILMLVVLGTAAPTLAVDLVALATWWLWWRRKRKGRST
jgi:hypothetical protein